MHKEQDCLKFREGKFVATTHEVIKEEPLSISINGRHFVTAMISPQMKKEFVIGHLFSEGVIKSSKEIESLQLGDDTANVIVAHPLKAVAARKIILTGCGTGSSFLDDSKLPKIHATMTVGVEDILSGVKSLLDHSELHRITGGVHVVGLFERYAQGYVAVSMVEDVGRHNALDKVIGYGLTRGIAFEKTFIVSTGRISSEMALKCAVANIPVIASRGATTSLAIEVAVKTGLCIIGFVRGDKMNVYTNPERIVTKGEES
ncbi:MAG: formate dehydrogenase accessory sulfurtransferase FdhD [Methanophagales archaeon ANME-1-THS]|nr:MAG: formate dehydrogenase accessory sulfurtransferase FdhD [Methanophagales archaeon ANME-1-THS]